MSMKFFMRSMMGALAVTTFALGTAESVAIVDLSAGPRRESLIEAGLFFGGGYVPDYPGSNENQARYLPLPFIIYRGSIVRADERDGVRARVVLAQRVHMELSVAGSFPVNSKNNAARQGMPDLDWLGEIGPRLTVFITEPKAQTRLKLLIPFRAVFSSNFQDSFKHRGFSLPPGLVLESFDFIQPHWRGIAMLSATFTDRQMNAYFYDVAPEFARADRPAYDARAGYLGSDLTLGMMIPFHGRYRLFTGVQWSYRDEAANAASPLFKSRTNYALFAGIAYTFFRSQRVDKE